MKKIVLFLFSITHTVFAQQEMTTSTGVLDFESSIPLYEEITAINKTVYCTLNVKNGFLTTEVKMKEFRFKLSLMEEHFNEKYLETEKYPLSSFKGTIEGFNINIVDENPKEFTIKGDLKIHGKTKKIKIKAVLKKVVNGLEIVSDFKVNAKDFNVDISAILSMKVAEIGNVKFYFFVE